MIIERLDDITIDDLFNKKRISTRTRNCCKSININTLTELLSYYEKYGSFWKYKIRNAGVKTCAELNNLCKEYSIRVEASRNSYLKIEEVYQLIMSLTPREREILESIAYLIIDRQKIFERKVKKYALNLQKQFILDFHNEHHHFPMLKNLEETIRNNNSRDIDILVNSYKIYERTKILSLSELAERHSLSRERIRQIRNTAFKRIFEIKKGRINNRILEALNFPLHEYDDWLYLLNSIYNFDLICHKSTEINNFLAKESCSFTKEFVLYIIAYVFSNEYSIFGGIENTNVEKSFSNTYIIKREYTKVFKFEEFRHKIYQILINNNNEYYLNLVEYVNNSLLWKKYDYKMSLKIVRIVKEFLLFEFGLYSTTENDMIKIPANIEKKPYDIVYEILLEAGRPMSLEEIFFKFKAILPHHKFSNPSQLRPYLNKHPDISFRNRNSIYTLKEWKHIKTGTIRNTIIEFLIENDLPQTAEDITKHVIQFFPDTNISSITTSMRSDSKNRFVSFDMNRFGLKNKRYPERFKPLGKIETSRKTFEQRLRDFELFVIKEHHFPFITSHNKEERALRRWWNSVINNVQKIQDYQIKEINRVRKQYSQYDIDKSIYDWNVNYSKSKCFILEYRRLPSPTGEEKYISRWLQKVIKDFQNNKLTEEQRLKFIELIKFI